MAPKSRGFERIANQLTSNIFRSSICRSCQKTIVRRNYASAAAAVQTVEQPPQSDSEPLHTTGEASIPQPTCKVEAGVVLSRPPLITPDPHPFETAYHLYQRRLNERLVLPFTQYFYYKRGTPGFEHWRTKRKERGGVATRDIGNYDAHNNESWNDEVLVGDKSADPQLLVEKLVEEEGRAAEFTGDGNAKTAGLKRKTQADETNDTRSLERKLDRTLYLLVKQANREEKHENWIFPSGSLEGKEGLREAAQRVLGKFCGVNMNTWFVGNHPVGFYIASTDETQHSESKSQRSSTNRESTAVREITNEKNDRIFFMKARILAGQANVKSVEKKYDDFQWLAKEEIQQKVHPRYWSRIKNMLVEQ